MEALRRFCVINRSVSCDRPFALIRMIRRQDVLQLQMPDPNLFLIRAYPLNRR